MTRVLTRAARAAAFHSVVPVYIAECAEKSSRGALATVPQLCISCGILTAYFTSLVVTLTTKGAWRSM